MNAFEHVADAAESPYWDPVSAKLLWVDIRAGQVMRCDPLSGAMEIFAVSGMPSFVAPLQSGEILCTTCDGLLALSPQSRALRLLHRPDWLGENMRFNDGTVDPCGRLVIGTMSLRKADIPFTGGLYAVDRDYRAHLLLGDLGIVNGLAFSPDGSSLYVADSHPKRRLVWQFDYDRATPTLGNCRLVVDFHAMGLPGTPDGAAMDAAGGYWVAAHGAAKLLRFAPAVSVWDVPCLQVSKPVFVSPARDRMAMTAFGSPLIVCDFGFQGSVLPRLAW